MTRTLLIDADVVAYKAAASAEQEIDWGDDLWTLHADASQARSVISGLVESYCKRLKADAVVIALSDKVNFRHSFYPEYKSNRKDKRKPTILGEVRDWLSKEYRCFIRPTLEADDVLGILSTAELIRGEKIIVSLDKDMRTIPGYVFNPDKDVQPTFISEDEADYFHMFQTLTGDRVDGYPGLPGCGPAGAAKVLADGADWPKVVEAYEKQGLTEADALVQARCARILRVTDYDFKLKQPILWSPK